MWPPVLNGCSSIAQETDAPIGHCGEVCKGLLNRSPIHCMMQVEGHVSAGLQSRRRNAINHKPRRFLRGYSNEPAGSHIHSFMRLFALGEVHHGRELQADLETVALPWTETGDILSSAHFKPRMRAAIMGACSCSAISAAASSASLIANNARDEPLALRLVNAYLQRSSSPKVIFRLLAKILPLGTCR